MFDKNKDNKKRATPGKEERKRRHVIIVIVCNKDDDEGTPWISKTGAPSPPMFTTPNPPSTPSSSRPNPPVMPRSVRMNPLNPQKTYWDYARDHNLVEDPVFGVPIPTPSRPLPQPGNTNPFLRHLGRIRQPVFRPDLWKSASCGHFSRRR
jgi:hypothetical protein